MLGDYRIGTLSKAKSKAKTKAVAKPKVTPKPATSPKPVITGLVTAAAVRSHAAATDCWTIINNNIYDLTLWIAKHPGGPAVIKSMCGVDASIAFVGAHGTMGLPIRTLGTYMIGTVVSSSATLPKPSDTATAIDTSTAGVTLSVAEVAKHSSPANCWSIINGNVYNLSNWVNAHPGGSGVITAICGIDGSAAFNNYHKTAKNPADTLSRFFMGAVGSTTANTTPAAAPSIAPKPAPVVTPPAPTGPGTNGETLTLTIVAAHGTVASCWAVINNNVYDLTNWVSAHPGGTSQITAICGKDGSAAFNGYTHSNQSIANSTLASFKIGTLGSPATVGTPPPAPTPTVTPAPTVTPPAPTGPGTNGETLTLTIVAAHGTVASCWAVINNNVYDLTNWVSAHPGGTSQITAICGKDGSAAFNGYTHSNQSIANSTLASFKIGTLGSPATVGTPPPAPVPVATVYTAAQVKAHGTSASCWSAINLTVYDLTGWIALHPGGRAVIQAACGRNASSVFNGKHAGDASVATQMKGYAIGVITSAQQGTLTTAIKP